MHTLIKITWIPILILLLFLMHHLVTPNAPSRSLDLKRVAKGSMSQVHLDNSYLDLDDQGAQRLGRLIQLN